MSDPNEQIPNTAGGIPSPAAGSQEPAGGVLVPPHSPSAPVEIAPVVEPVAPAAPELRPSLLQTFVDENKPPVVEVPKVEEPAKAPDPAKPAEASKPGEEAKPGEEKPAEGEVAAPVVEAPLVYTAFELPEGVAVDNERMAEFTGVLGKHRLSQEVGQELMSMHAGVMQQAMNDFARSESERQHRVWNETRAEWNREVLADERIGGSGHNTAMGAIARMRDALVPEAERPAFDQFLAVTGAGDHPQFLRMLHRVAEFLDEPRIPDPTIRPPADLGRKPNGRLRDSYKPMNG